MIVEAICADESGGVSMTDQAGCNTQVKGGTGTGQIDRDAPGFVDFARFIAAIAIGTKIVQIQRQECAVYGGAQRWNRWHAPELITVEQLMSMYPTMLNTNMAKWNPVDWHIRLVGTPPIWTLDDVLAEDVAQMYTDNIAPFTIVETSVGNYQAWVKLRSDGVCVTPDAWHLIHRHFRERYGADKGAGGTGHAFRLPLPGAFSHKRAEPFRMQIRVNDTVPVMSVTELLSQISRSENKLHIGSTVHADTVSGYWGTEGVDVPEWFLVKWSKRYKELTGSPHCPRKSGGTPDWSSVDFCVTGRSLWGYRAHGVEKQANAALWLIKILEMEAAKRGKPKPAQYARRTVFNAANQLGLEIAFCHEPEGRRHGQGIQVMEL